MKKFTLSSIAIAFIISLSLVANAQTRKPKIGLAMNNQFLDRWIKEKEIMTSYIYKLGGDVVWSDARDNMDIQIKQTDLMIQQGVDVIILVPVDSRRAAGIVDKAQANGVDVIAYERLVLGTENLDYYIAFNNIKVGELMAQHMLTNRPNGDYMIINGPEKDYNTQLLEKGFMNVLQPGIDSGSIRLALNKHLDEWSGAMAGAEVAWYLAKDSAAKIDAILGGNDEIGIAIVKILQELEMDGDILVSGQDADLAACRMIVNDQFSATIWKDVKTLAIEASYLAMSLANGETIPAPAYAIDNGAKEIPSVLMEPVLVTKENLDETVIKAGYWAVNQVYEH